MSLLPVRNPLLGSAWENGFPWLGVGCHSEGTGFVCEPMGYVCCASFSNIHKCQHTHAQTHACRHAHKHACAHTQMHTHLNSLPLALRHTYTHAMEWNIHILSAPSACHLNQTKSHLALERSMLLSEQSKAIKRERQRVGKRKVGDGAKVGLCNFKDDPKTAQLFIMEFATGECLESGLG